MDPDANLTELRALMAGFIRSIDADAPVDETDVDRAAELFTALDEWIIKGGFLPTDWTNR